MKTILIFIIVGLLLIGCSNDRVLKVGIQPFNDFDKILCDSVSSAIKRTYKVDTYILKTRQIPKEAFINIKSPRYQADKLIKMLKDNKPDSLDYIIGLTNKDISFSKKDEYGKIKEPQSKYSDWGIFGLGYRPGPSSIISTYRLKNQSKNEFEDRVKKVAIHEFGHNLGLDHCESELCVMRDAVESIQTINKVKPELCIKCIKKIELMYRN